MSIYAVTDDNGDVLWVVGRSYPDALKRWEEYQSKVYAVAIVDLEHPRKLELLSEQVLV